MAAFDAQSFVDALSADLVEKAPAALQTAAFVDEELQRGLLALQHEIREGLSAVASAETSDGLDAARRALEGALDYAAGGIERHVRYTPLRGPVEEMVARMRAQVSIVARSFRLP